MQRPESSTVAQLLPLHPQGFLLEYGNPHGTDLDLFGVVNEPVVMSWVLGAIDLHILPTEECRRLAAHFDPAVTEPLANGRFVDGDRVLYLEIHELAHEAKPTREAGLHLLRRSMAELARAASWLSEFMSVPTARGAQGFLMALSYCVSYAEGSRRILIETLRPVGFAELQASNPLLSAIRTQLAAAKAGNHPTIERARETMATVEAAVVGIELLP